jgi:hypothetical protein
MPHGGVRHRDGRAARGRQSLHEFRLLTDRLHADLPSQRSGTQLSVEPAHREYVCAIRREIPSQHLADPQGRVIALGRKGKVVQEPLRGRRALLILGVNRSDEEGPYAVGGRSLEIRLKQTLLHTHIVIQKDDQIPAGLLDRVVQCPAFPRSLEECVANPKGPCPLQHEVLHLGGRAILYDPDLADRLGETDPGQGGQRSGKQLGPTARGDHYACGQNRRTRSAWSVIRSGGFSGEEILTPSSGEARDETHRGLAAERTQWRTGAIAPLATPTTGSLVLTRC